jgi:predicted nucleic acid-binding protein
MKADFNRSMNIEIDAVIDQVVKALDPAILTYCKDYFEKNFLYILEDKLEMSLIIDANIVISDALSLVENKKSFLLELMKSPFLKLLAPNWLKNELDRKIPEISRKKKIDESRLRDAVSLLTQKVIICDLNDTAYLLAYEKVGYRDPKDVPYVALYFSIKSHGILTQDKDISAVPEIKIWERPGSVSKVINVFEKGSFSFLIIGEGLPLVFRFLYEICVAVLKSIWDIVQMFGSAIYSLIQEGVTAISKWPNWVKALVGISTALGIAVILLWEKSRKIIVGALQSLVSDIIAVLNWFYQGIKNIMSIIAPFVEISIEVLRVLFAKIEETITTYKQLSLETVM